MWDVPVGLRGNGYDSVCVSVCVTACLCVSSCVNVCARVNICLCAHVSLCECGFVCTCICVYASVCLWAIPGAVCWSDRGISGCTKGLGLGKGQAVRVGRARLHEWGNRGLERGGALLKVIPQVSGTVVPKPRAWLISSLPLRAPLCCL